MYQDFLCDIKTILNRITRGDERAFQTLFDHYKEKFYSSAFKMTRSADHAEEIVQEVFVTVWLKRGLISTVEKPESYLYMILRNCIYAHFRKVVRERRLKLKISEEKYEDSVETLLIEKERRCILRNAINQLPLQQRIVYRLAKQEGISREEIARKLNISPNTVRNHLAAAVDFLRSWVKANETALTWILLSFYWASDGFWLSGTY